MAPGLKASISKLRRFLLNVIGLQTPVSRLTLISVITLCIYEISYQKLISLPALSLYSRLHIMSPSIGLTRAYWYLIHGQWSEAYNMNRLIYVVAVVIISILAVDSYKIVKSKIKLNN